MSRPQPRERVVRGRRYVNSEVVFRGNWLWPCCEHCDGEHSVYAREDSLRGFVCPSCDSALDEMFEERSP